MANEIKTISMESLEDEARELAVTLDHGLQDRHGQRIGFALILFTFGDSGSLTWISNAQRGDMIKAMEEWLHNVKNRS